MQITGRNREYQYFQVKVKKNPLVMLPSAPQVDTDLLIILLSTASVITQWITPAIYQALWPPKEPQMMH